MIRRLLSACPTGSVPSRAFLTTVLVTIAGLLPSPGSAQERQPVLDPSDLSGWMSVRASAVSPDGAWVVVQVAPNEGDGEVILRATDGSSERRFGVGAPTARRGRFGAAAGAVSLSEDGEWLAFTTYPTREEADAAKKAKESLSNGVTLVNIDSGEERTFDRVRGYEFAGADARWFVMDRAAAKDTPKDTGSDLLLLELATGMITVQGSVGGFDVNESGAWLAWTTQSPDRVGNGVSVRDLRSGVVRTLDSESALFTRLAWADEDADGEWGTALSVLKGLPDTTMADTTYMALGFTGFGGSINTTTVNPEVLEGFPEDMRMRPSRGAQWSDDRSALFFGVAERVAVAPSEDGRPKVNPVAGIPGRMQTPAPDLSDDDDLATLVLWHGRDDKLQARQQVQENADRDFSFLAAYYLSDRRFVELASEDIRRVTLASGQHRAIGLDSNAYNLRDAIDGGSHSDVYALDTRSGDRQKILTAQRWPVSLSPDGNKALYFKDRNYHVYDFAQGSHTNITGSMPVSFVNVEDDHNVIDPPIRGFGWTADSDGVLLSDAWDVWMVSADGSSEDNLTKNGRSDGVRYRRPLAYDSDVTGTDLSQPVYLGVYGERTKKSGVVRLTSNGQKVERILWEDAFHTLTRARDRETFVYTKETFNDFPDVWSARGDFDNVTRLTDLNPQQTEFAWSAGSRLVDYVTDKGDSLQAALFLPADYEEGTSYPTVVYIYEKLSQNLHRYVQPDETRAFNASVFTSRGYAVLMPDIVYKLNDPGMSAVWAVVPAVKAAIETGVVDEEKVGIHGHSWGGYQTAFLITQTDIFNSAIAGAALTDMVSMYHSVYWNSGGANAAIFESSQGRFLGSPTQNYDAYIRNSPVFHVDNVTTPVVLLHNEKDGAVDFNQGITYFNALRESEKDVVLLQYVGENHGLRSPTNQKDYTVRMREFFDHYLKDLPAPDWWVNGVPRLEMEEHLKGRKAKLKIVS